MRTDEKQNPGRAYICLAESSEKVRFQHSHIDEEEEHHDDIADEDGFINLMKEELRTMKASIECQGWI